MTQTFHITILGTSSVGKTSIVERYVSNIFKETYDPTCENVKTKNIEMNNTICHLEIHDTAGTDQFKTMRATYIKNSSGFILVFGFNILSSLIELEEFYYDVEEIRKDDCVIYLCGNKDDIQGSERVITEEQVEDFLKERQMKYIKTSAKTGSNIDELFHQLTSDLLEKYKKPEKSWWSWCNLL